MDVHRVIQATALGLGIALAILSVHERLLWTDGRAYWLAAERLREGLDLYPASIGTEASEVYRYAPWFAWAWVPLTHLPERLVAVGWIAAMTAAWAIPVIAFTRSGWKERCVAFLAGPPLLMAALGGNVHPAIVLLLFAGMERRWGPAAIGVAASLKLFPILFVTVYLGRGQLVRAAAAVGLGAFLWLPALASDMRAYPAAIGGALSLLAVSPVAYATVCLLAIGLAVRRSSWPAASVAVAVAASMRFIPYQLGYLLCSRPQLQPAPESAAALEAFRTARRPAATLGSSTAASTGSPQGSPAPDAPAG
jgi:Glycosyltransferase family 87